MLPLGNDPRHHFCCLPILEDELSTITRILATIAIAAFTVGPVSAATAPNATTLVAQASTGAINGTAVDESGAPIVGATVTVRGPQTYTATTDAKGAFAISNIAAALYRITIQKNGYDTASQPDFAIFAGEKESLAITMHSATLTTLQTIATVRTVGRGTFNTSPAAVNSIPSQAFLDNAAPQVTRVLNQVPGISISLPGTSANGAVPGAITFPNIRGALSFETASLIDGHPVSVGTFGDYVTTFLNSNMLGGVDVIKGPGASSPQVNYAIGGTVNFRTKDPTLNVTPDYSFGMDSRGGTILNLGVSDTLANGHLGFVFEIANEDTPSAVNGYQAYFNPASNAVLNYNAAGTRILGNTTTSIQVPGTDSKVTAGFPLVACCYSVSGQYHNLSELLKVRWKFSDATTATVSYLGSQTDADQNGNTSSQTSPALAFFAPASAAYTNTTLVPGPFTFTSIHPGGNDLENNNEPILQAEVRTTLGADTLLGRFYHAGIHRLINQGSGSPNVPTIVTNTFYGKDSTGVVYNGTPVSVAYFDFFQQAENDALNGTSFEWDHPFNDLNTLSFAWDATNSTTQSYSESSNAAFGVFNPTAAPFFSITLPAGSSQLFNTFLLRDRFTLNSKLSGTASLYSNLYRSTFPISRAAVFGVDGTGYTFGTSNTSHFDQRLALEYRPKQNLAVRGAMGSAIAPPYLQLLSGIPGASATYSAASQTALVSFNAGLNGLKPETAWGYDVGADYRFHDGVTYLSGDAYLTNLYNHFIGSTTPAGFTCSTIPSQYTFACTGAGFTATTPVYFSTNINLNNARFEGFELQLKRVVQTGIGYSIAASVNHSYAYNLPANFYCSFVVTPSTPCTPDKYNTNRAIIAGNQLTQGPIGFNGFSNQNVPMLTGNAEINFHAKNGAFAAFGETLYGRGNSYNLPPFGIAYLNLRYPISHSLALQVSGDNIFNGYSNLFPYFGSGLALPIVGTTGPNGPGSVSTGQAATMANNLGPATWKIVFTKNIGPEPVGNP
jgi:outer membrane receptor protein involved in Fe transport